MGDFTFTVLSSRNETESKKWDGLISRYFHSEPMLRPRYCALFEGESGEALCALAEFAQGVVLYPFILRQIGGGLSDLTTPYGYGGPVYSGAPDAAEIDRFWNAFDRFARQKGAVSEFIRFSLFSPGGLRCRGQLVTTAENIIRPLEGRNMAELRTEFEHKVRKNVNRANALHVQVEADETGGRLDGFMNIYYATMERRGAAAEFYFGRPFFEQIGRMQGSFAYFFASLAGRPVSAELVLVSDENIYSFLGGTLKEYFTCRPNDLLKYKIIEWGIGRGKKNYVLGGGHSPGDGIFRYKRSFAPAGAVPFVTGRRIFDSDAYARLSENRLRAAAAAGLTPGGLQQNYFPLYRVPFSNTER